MSEIRLNVLDVSRAIHGTIHGGAADSVVAGLSAEPATIEELQNAVDRFIKPIDNCKLFSAFLDGIDGEPWDAGIMFIDVAARVVATESSYSIPLAMGSVPYHNGAQATDLRLPYRVPDDWLFVSSVAEYECICNPRRAEFAASPPLDTRRILYGEVVDFIVRQCLAARDLNAENPIAEIHARWLMTPRDDLRGLSPREVVLLKRNFIDEDLQSRELQWSFLGEPALCLEQDSTAYRFAGFGTHEVVVYYELLRFLLSKFWKRIKIKRDIRIEDEVARLGQIKNDWLERPQPDFSGRSPAYILECERKRLPLIVSAKEAVMDDDCPLCQAMSKEPMPTFCHLDGSNMDDAFPFSFCRTREEWEEEERGRKEFEDEFNLWWEQRNAN